ncbi:MAG: rhodanese-like domain-containing protein [Gammaproteobacteria bacterium]|nr:rhodanese-like domain-containing protein [Gammaproteobacteria bacterium]
MKHFTDLVNEALHNVKELFPWDLEEQLQQTEKPLLLDVREADEYHAMHIKDSLWVPRGILESACEYDYDDTLPELVEARDRDVVVICRSGNRSVLAALTLHQLGYQKVFSLKTGLRGWNDYELPLIDQQGNEVDIDAADEFFRSKLRPEQRSPK